MFDFDRVLDPKPMNRETGWERLADGSLLVSVRTDMHGITGEMFHWWFTSRPLSREYRWWHPFDHHHSEWVGGTEGAVPGSMHVIVEDMNELKRLPLRVQFIEPTDLVSAEKLAAARKARHVSVIIAGRTADGHDGSRDAEGNLLGGRLLHTGRDTSWGMVLRSRFLIGSDLTKELSPEQIAQSVGDEIGPNLVQHCYEEFTYLSRILPSLYLAEGSADASRVEIW
ncbi:MULTISPECIES: DAPG hydrolase family protein [unclassified Arthrobacter]|uniref:DAPG hydrolase family protein n=1 Tax=unclassified Arthrobacter TaxID=235627 RepID=UPI001C8559D9|nr:hypothetical protein [Arthrobacter sp. MAHUQ-56]MBX7445917.1 hypothetical protein [Arthrobacter sp. MAHUQ-56]